MGLLPVVDRREGGPEKDERPEHRLRALDDPGISL
jgi:hypothetical protein